jgi:hypothetical protein
MLFSEVTMSRPELLDVVELVRDLPGRERKRGKRGTIVECFPGDVYMVEFHSEDPDEETLFDIPEGDLRVVWRIADHPVKTRSSA